MNHLIRDAMLAAAMLSAISGHAQTPAAARAEDAATRAIARIQRADYEGDRAALRRLHKELAPFRDDRRHASRVRYWQGFALWRRAFNGFNESADSKDLEQDLLQAIREFEDAARRDPGFIDANVGVISCLQTLTFLHRNDAARVNELVPRFVKLLKESLAAAPDNPRLLWVHGASQWYAPPGLPAAQVQERQARALATYERGLQLARKQKNTASHPLEPSWGEPELLMSLAWANLNRTAPDVRAAEGHANQALGLVPYWHYVRDILMPQIRSARNKR